MPQTITVRAGDTEPLEYTIGATGLANLDALTTATLILWRAGQQDNHVEAAVDVADSAALLLRFDPVGAKVGGGDALDEPGQYRGYTRCLWSDGDETRHPAESDLVITVTSNRE